MSAGELDELISDKEQKFLDTCRNAITILEASDILKKIENSRKAQTIKNRRDASEFLGKELPNMSLLLPKVFESPKVQVLKYPQN